MKKNIIKVKKFQKPLICLVIMLLMVLSFIVGKITNAKADNINYEYQSLNIDYDNSISNLNATNVKDAIDELYDKVGQCPSGYNCLTDEEFLATGTKVLRAYTYNENSCVTGEEEKCKKTFCYLLKNKNSCPSGTIIDYKVNNTETVRFHVLHDDGDTLTMQSQQSQVKGVMWHAGESDTSYGPDTMLSRLESQTSGWVNVKDIEYNGDNTKFVGVEELSNIPSDMKNNNNYCTSYNSCTSNTYTYPSRIVKARMIMMQEAVDVGCTTAQSTCPKFIYNYLYDATSFGATRNDNINGNFGYWTMGVYSASLAWFVGRDGGLAGNYISNPGGGARAVVVVNK